MYMSGETVSINLLHQILLEVTFHFRTEWQSTYKQRQIIRDIHNASVDVHLLKGDPLWDIYRLVYPKLSSQGIRLCQPLSLICMYPGSLQA